MKKNLMLVVVLLVIILGGAYWYQHSKKADTVATSDTKAQIFLKNMKQALGVNYEIKSFNGYQNMNGYRLDFPQSFFSEARAYLSSHLKKLTTAEYATERGNGYSDGSVLCFDVGLGAGSLEGTLPYVWCTDKK